MLTVKDLVAKAGSLTKLQRAVNSVEGYEEISYTGVSQWVQRNQIPVERVWQVAEAMHVAPWEIRPDIFFYPEEYFRKVSKCLPE